ncbi:MAG: D-alanyl-D-alanine dipeptidase [Pseudomonadota bacterium]
MADDSPSFDTPSFDTAETLVAINPPALPVDCQPVYASSHNVLHHPLYNRLDCYLRPDAANALAAACRHAAADGYTFRIFDAYRPTEAQFVFWQHTPDPDYVADPRLGSTHGRGIALDLTLLDRQGMPIPMGTEFDDFSIESHHDFGELPPEIIANRHLLRRYMEEAGFVIHAPEWWHYNLPNPSAYPLISDGEAVPPMLRPEMRKRADDAMAALNAR